MRERLVPTRSRQVAAWWPGLVLVLSLSVTGVDASPVQAQPSDEADSWTQVTDSEGRNIDQVGVVRTDDGVLHVLWRKRAGTQNEEIQSTPIESDGSVGTATLASGGWSSAGNPDVVVMPDGSLRTFFAALTPSTSALDGVISASTGADDETWASPTKVSSTSSAIPEGVGAAVAPDGTPWFTYAYSFVLGLHQGLDPAVADTDLIPENQCCAYQPDIAFSDEGDGYVGWYSNVEGEVGLWVQQVAPTMGTKVLVPDSVDAEGKMVAPDQRMPIAARQGESGVYVAYCSGYPSCTKVLLWEVGSDTPIEVGRGSDIEDVNIAAAPDGRMWVMWQDASEAKLYASRSNEDVSEFGGAAELDPASGATTIWKVAGDATDDDLDVLASMTTPDSLATWHTKVLPGLGVDVTKKRKQVTVTVQDAGVPVKGAKVRVGKQTFTTDKSGKAKGTVKVKSGDVEVSKSGYTTAQVPLAAS
jgi:hypothetical protein